MIYIFDIDLSSVGIKIETIRPSAIVIAVNPNLDKNWTILLVALQSCYMLASNNIL